MIVLVDDAAMAHLAAALRLHERRLRVNGRCMPASVTRLLGALNADSRGLARPSLAGDAPAGNDGRMLFDAIELGEVLHTSERTARRLMASGEVPSVRVAGQRLTRVEDLRRYIEQLPATNDKSVEE